MKINLTEEEIKQAIVLYLNKKNLGERFRVLFAVNKQLVDTGAFYDHYKIVVTATAEVVSKEKQKE